MSRIFWCSLLHGHRASVGRFEGALAFCSRDGQERTYWSCQVSNWFFFHMSRIFWCSLLHGHGVKAVRLSDDLFLLIPCPRKHICSRGQCCGYSLLKGDALLRSDAGNLLSNYPDASPGIYANFASMLATLPIFMWYPSLSSSVQSSMLVGLVYT